MSVGKSILRVDAYDKVTGRAMYTDDLAAPGMLVAKVVRSTIANGLVKGFDLEEAQKVPGVVKILTCFDAPAIDFPTAGHPWSTDSSHQDVRDRRLLNQRVRIHGDDIAVVVAEDEVAAARAARLIKVEYEEYQALVTPRQAMEEGAPQLHEGFPGNILRDTTLKLGDMSFEEAAQGAALLAELAAATGGEALADVAEACSRLPRGRRPVPLAPYAYLAAGLLFLLEIFERRTGWFDARRRRTRAPQTASAAPPATPRGREVTVQVTEAVTGGPPSSTVTTEIPPPDPPPESPLARAKRRARERTG